MTKYMTMAEAFKCRDEDIPFIAGGWNGGKSATKKYILTNSVTFPSPEAIASQNWQVQKAEPKILTTEEFEFNLEVKSEPNCHRCWLQGNRNGFEAGEKNGQLREWLRSKELREAVGSYQCDAGNYGKLKEALKNLTPPEDA